MNLQTTTHYSSKIRNKQKHSEMSSEEKTDALIKYLTDTFKNNKIINVTDSETDYNALLDDRKTIVVVRRIPDNEKIFKQKSKKYSTRINYFIFHGYKYLYLTEDFSEVAIRKFMASEKMKCNGCDEVDGRATYCAVCGYFICKSCKKNGSTCCPQCGKSWN